MWGLELHLFYFLPLPLPDVHTGFLRLYFGNSRICAFASMPVEGKSAKFHSFGVEKWYENALGAVTRDMFKLFRTL